MNIHEQERIADAMNRLRPDWPVKQLRTLLADGRLAERPRRDIAVALAWVACDAASHNPYRVLETGPWWIATAVDGQTTGRREPFDPTRFCGVCNKPNDARHPGDHGFVSAMDERRTKVDGDKKTAAIEYARSGIGDAKADREPEPDRPPLEALPEVDRLRELARQALADDRTTHREPTPPTIEGGSV